MLLEYEVFTGMIELPGAVRIAWRLEDGHRGKILVMVGDRVGEISYSSLGQRTDIIDQLHELVLDLQDQGQQQIEARENARVTMPPIGERIWILHTGAADEQATVTRHDPLDFVFSAEAAGGRTYKLELGDERETWRRPEHGEGGR